MKPVNFNQLLFHPRTATLSIFFAPTSLWDDQHDAFIGEIILGLRAKVQEEQVSRLTASLDRVKRIVNSHPRQGHGFFYSSSLQGYMAIDAEVENYFILGPTFHVRPLLEELFINPEFFLVNAHVTQVRVFRGDFRSLEIQAIHELSASTDEPSQVYAPMSKNSLAQHKILGALRGIARKVSESISYENLPVLVSGPPELRGLFLLQLRESSREVIELKEDFLNMPCLEVLDFCKPQKPAVLDFHSRILVERIRRMIKKGQLISELGAIIGKVRAGEVIQLILPARARIFGTVDWESGHFEVHAPAQTSSVDILNELAEELMRQEGRIKILPQHFFPAGTQVLAVIEE